MKQKNTEKILKEGFQKAKAITRQYAKTFYFASKFLPIEKRLAAYSIYAICRISDDSVDTQGLLPKEKQLIKVKENIEAAYHNSSLKDPLLVAFKKTIFSYKIPKQYFDDLLCGMSMDLTKNRYRDFDELYLYCYRVAGVIGLIMLKILGSNNTLAQKYAVELGIAMQLTNILRDIREDYILNRIYLPQDEMKKFHVTENHICLEKTDDHFRSLLKFQIKRTKEFYQSSEQGIKMITTHNCRFVIKLMKEMYGAILTSIAKNNYDVFSQRAHINFFQKTLLYLKIFLESEHL
ncbi:MAG: phytoene/squalene synthase family protein [Candidatus Omnitrophota bacterium]